VSLWTRWVDEKRVPWEVLYTLTSNEPDVIQNGKRAGDRLLSLFQQADGRHFFSTYTITPEDGFKYIYHECPIPEDVQGSWVYTYFGYSRKA
jgi:hypothetical protein